MSKPYKFIKLSDEDRMIVTDTLRKGVHSSRTITRCRILLNSAEGKRAQEIATSLAISTPTVYQTLKRYEENGLAFALTEKPRPGQPRKVTAEIEAHITSIACSHPPEGRSRWTLKLIADRLIELEYIESISEDAVRSVLKKVY